MARLDQKGFEQNSLTAGIEPWTTVSTTGASITGSAARSGSYGLRISSLGSGTQAGVLYQWVSSTQAGPFWLRVYLNVQTAPSASNHIISFNGATGSVGSTERCKITLEADRTLILRNNSGTQIGSTSSILSTNNWYMVDLKTDASPASGSRIIEARLNGSVFATSSTQSQGNAFAYSVGGNLDGESQTTGEWWFDDIAVNDSTGSFQTSYPGEGKIIHVRPDSQGDANGFLTQVGGTAGAANNYTRVSETTPDDATSYNGSAVLNAEDLFNVNAPPIGSSDTINVVALGVRTADLVVADATAAFKVELEKTSGGTKSQSGTIIPNSTSWVTNAPSAPRNYPLITYQDPDASNWTLGTLDTMQIGYIQTATNVQTIAVSTIWASIDYTSVPAANVSDTITFSESYSLVITDSTTVSDTINTSESLTHYSDQIDLMEMVKLTLVDTASISDSITLSENTVLFITSSINKSDTITISENVNLLKELLVSTSDSLALSEDVTVARASGGLFIDTITLSESIHLEVESHPQLVGVALEHHIEMTRYIDNVSGTANTYIEVPRIATRFDRTAYDGDVEVYLEATIRNAAASGTAYVELYNHTDGSSVSGSEITTAPNTFALLVRSGVITLSGDKIYTVRLKHSTSTTDTQVASVRLIVIQRGNITKTQLHQELGIEGTTSSTSSANILTGAAAFLYEATKYDGTVTVRHDAVLTTTSGNSATSGIYDVDASSVVSSSEVTKSNDTTATLVSSSGITLTDGHTYRPTAYVSGGAAAQFDNSSLVFTITGGFTKFLAYISVLSDDTTGQSNSTNIFPDYLVQADNYINLDPNTLSGIALATYYEAMIATTNAAQTTHSNLQDYLYGVSATNIEGSDVTHTGDTTPTRKRSSSFALPSANKDIASGVSNTASGNGRVYNSYIIFEVSGMQNDELLIISESLVIVIADDTRVQDNLTIAESVLVEVLTFINVQDTLTLTDLPLFPGAMLSISDSATLSESLSHYSDLIDIVEFVRVTISGGQENINRSDSITLSETITVICSSTLITASDSLASSELVVISIVDLITSSDSVSLSENVSLTVVYDINVSESVTLSETTNTSRVYAIGVSDSVLLTEHMDIIRGLSRDIIIIDNRLLDESGDFLLDENGNYITDENPNEFLFLSESVRVTRVNNVSQSDSISFTESVTIQSFIAGVSRSDTITFTEQITVSLVDNLSVSDSITLSENIKLLNEYLVNTNQSLTLNEGIELLIPTLFIAVSDSLNLSEAILFVTPPNMGILESMIINEAVSLLMSVATSRSDTLTVTESIKLAVIDIMAVSDTLSFTEASQLSITSFVNQSDSALASEALAVTIAAATPASVSVSDSLTVSENRQLQITSFIIRSDTASLTEVVSLVATPFFITVSDSVIFSEQVNIFRRSLISRLPLLGAG